MHYCIFIVDNHKISVLRFYAVWHYQGMSGGWGMDFGDRIKLRREKLRLTQAELAELAGVNQALISRIESKVSAGTSTDILKRLALALGCTADYLIGMYDEEGVELCPVAEALV